MLHRRKKWLSFFSFWDYQPKFCGDTSFNCNWQARSYLKSISFLVHLWGRGECQQHRHRPVQKQGLGRAGSRWIFKHIYLVDFYAKFRRLYVICKCLVNILNFPPPLTRIRSRFMASLRGLENEIILSAWIIHLIPLQKR